LGTINFGLIGFFGASLTPSLQIRLMDVAGDAQTLAASLNHSALNLANAAGAAIGGIVVGPGMGYAYPAFAGAALSAAAFLIWIGQAFVKKDGGHHCIEVSVRIIGDKPWCELMDRAWCEGS